MIRGTVTAEAAPVVAIDVGNGRGGFQSLSFIVDTGFTGELSMPPDVIRRLALPYADQARVTLADARELWTRNYSGIALWHGRRREVRVIEMDGNPLLGMSLLWGSSLTVSTQPGGSVLIEEPEQ